MVFGLEGHHLKRVGGVENQVELRLQLLVDRELGPADRPGGAVGQFLGDLTGLGVDLFHRHGVVHQTHAGGIGALDERAAHEELLGTVGAYQERPDHRAAVARHQADLHMRVGDARTFGGHGDVAKQARRWRPGRCSHR